MAAKTGTYTLINSTTLTGSASDITFSSIPGTYTDLVLVVASLDNGGGRTRLRVNGDTGSNYSRTNLCGNGSSAATYRGTNETLFDMSVIAGTSSTNPATLIIHINDYSNTTTYKTILSRYSLASGAVEESAGLWRNTAAITSVTYLTQGSLLSGTTARLYGIEAAK